ncbi:MAG: ABC transporter ATP-binding protein [Gammaproteobacteria bacterium]|nr:ABC transporter ATP-binding protein [Gammaproteobacteria bacterium]
MSSLIDLKHVTKTYDLGVNTFTALSGVDLQIKKGEMTAIIGVSGSGKSTLMNIIGMLDHPTSGHYYFSGENVSALKDEALATIRNQKIGFVFQSFFLLARSNALQNVMLPLFYRGTDRVTAKTRAMAMLEKVGVAHLAHHRPNQLSGGQQQRVAIARALVGDPEVVLADEPTGALDSQTGKEVMDLFINLNRHEGRTIVIITHDQGISQQCQRTLTIQDGKLSE